MVFGSFSHLSDLPWKVHIVNGKRWTICNFWKKMVLQVNHSQSNRLHFSSHICTYCRHNLCSCISWYNCIISFLSVVLNWSLSFERLRKERSRKATSKKKIHSRLNTFHLANSNDRKFTDVLPGALILRFSSTRREVSSNLDILSYSSRIKQSPCHF